MPRERRPTEHVESLIKQSRVRVIIPLQALFLAAACGLVWGWLGATHTAAAFGIIGTLVVVEVLLVYLFLRQPVESDETMVQLLSESPERAVLADPTGGTIVVDKQAGIVSVRDGELSVPLASVRSVLVDLGEHCRLMLATDDDLVVLVEFRNALSRERAEFKATARLLARVAALPFDGA